MTQIEREVRNVEPRPTKASVRKTIAEIRRLHREREAALLGSVGVGHIAFWLRQPASTRSTLPRPLLIFDPENPEKYYYFATVRTDTPIRDIENPNKPFDLLVNKSKNRNINKPIDVAKSLAEFVKELFPEAGATSFSLYTSPRAYQKDKALVEYVHPTEYIKKINEEHN